MDEPRTIAPPQGPFETGGLRPTRQRHGLIGKTAFAGIRPVVTRT